MEDDFFFFPPLSSRTQPGTSNPLPDHCPGAAWQSPSRARFCLPAALVHPVCCLNWQWYTPAERLLLCRGTCAHFCVRRGSTGQSFWPRRCEACII